MKKLILVAAIAALACLMSLPTRMDIQAREDEGHGQTRSIFSVVSKDAKTGHMIILSGASTFGTHHIEGGGGFTHFNPVGAPPFPIVAHGTYRATKLLSFTPVKGSPYGEQIAGVLHTEVVLRPVGGKPVTATMKVVCNVLAGALFTGDDEGVTLAVHGGGTFEPTGTGITIFNPARGD